MDDLGFGFDFHEGGVHYLNGVPQPVPNAPEIVQVVAPVPVPHPPPHPPHTPLPNGAPPPPQNNDVRKNLFKDFGKGKDKGGHRKRRKITKRTNRKKNKTRRYRYSYKK